MEGGGGRHHLARPRGISFSGGSAKRISVHNRRNGVGSGERGGLGEGEGEEGGMRDGRTADGRAAQKREKISKNRESGSPSSVPLARSPLSVRPSEGEGENRYRSVNWIVSDRRPDVLCRQGSYSARGIVAQRWNNYSIILQLKALNQIMFNSFFGNIIFLPQIYS